MDKEKSRFKLPEGWIWTTIGEIGILSSGGTPSRGNSSYFNGDIPWVKSGELNYNIINDSEEKITQEALDFSSAKIIPANSLLIALYGSTVGKIATLGIDASTNQAVAAIETFPNFNQRFLYYYLLHNREKLLQKRKGGAQPNISQKILSEFRFPFPPFREQNQIVSKIEELFSELEHSQKGLQKAKNQLEVYKQALLKSAFEGKLTVKWRVINQSANAFKELKTIRKDRKKEYDLKIKNGTHKIPKPDYNFTFKPNNKISSWANANLENLIDINARIGWRGLTKNEYTIEGPLLLSVYALNYGKNVVFKDANHITKTRYEESPEIKLQINDILLCKDGAGIGKVGLINYLPDEATVNSSLLVIRGKEVFNPNFLYYFFSGPAMQRLVNEKISGSAIPHLFQKDIKKFDLKIPPKEEQNQIVEALELRYTLIENLEKAINRSLNDIEVIRHSILKQAFEGKLIRQNPSDEPGIILLKKIKIEKETHLFIKREAEKIKPQKKRQMETRKTVLEILQKADRPISAKELWQKSIHSDDIESFYDELKEIYSKLVEVKQNTKSLLSIKK
jgi:type I restriction enzyme S subunit